MASDPSLWWAWVVPTLLATPWIVGIAWAWRRRPRDGAIPSSMSDRANRRLRVL